MRIQSVASLVIAAALLGGCEALWGSAGRGWVSELEARAGPVDRLSDPPRSGETDGWMELVQLSREIPLLSPTSAELIQRNGAGPLIFLDETDLAAIRGELRDRDVALQRLADRARSIRLSAPRQMGRTSFEYEELVADLEAIRSSATILLARSNMDLVDGNPSRAVDTYRSVFLLTETGIRSQGPLAVYDTFAGLQIDTLAHIRVAARRAKLTEAELQDLMSMTTPAPTVDAPLAESAAIELVDLIEPDVLKMKPKDAAFALSRLAGFSSAELNQIANENRRSFDPEETASILQYTYGFLARNAKRPWPDRSVSLSPALRELGSTLPMGLGRYGGQSDPQDLTTTESGQYNILGRALAIRYTVTFSRQRAISIRRLTDLAAHPTVIGCQIYRARHGRLPSELQDLVKSGILQNIPDDPATGQPFLYVFDAGRIWGAGVDGQLSSGPVRPGEFRQQQTDFVYPLF